MNRGFTLLEVLVALAIIAIALTALIRTTGQSADTTDAMEQRIRGQWLAQNQLALAQASQAWPEPGDTTGESTMSGRTYTWRQRVLATPNPNFRKLEITVAYRGEALMNLATSLRNPAR